MTEHHQTPPIPTASAADIRLDRAQALEFLKCHDRFLLVCHAHPDGDTLGAAMGLKALLELLGKEARLACASEIPKKLRFIVDGASDLSLNALAGWKYETVVTVDVACPSLLGEYETMFGNGQVMLAIDHHSTHSVFAQRLLLDATLAACAELIFDLAVLAFGYCVSRPMPPALAKPLYTGISTDSGNFMYSSVTFETHQRAAVLLASDIRHYEICSRLYENTSLSEVRAKRAAYDNMTLHFDGKVGMVVFDREVMTTYRLTDEDVDNVVNLIRSIEGVAVAVHIKYRDEGEFKVSMRSQVGYDVSRICQIFGGGGHICAAGCTLYETDPAIVVQRLLEQLKQVME